MLVDRHERGSAAYQNEKGLPFLGEYIQGSTIDFVVEARANNLEALLASVVSVSMKMYNENDSYTFLTETIPPQDGLPFAYRFYLTNTTEVEVGDYNLLLTVTYSDPTRTEKRRMGRIEVSVE